MLSRVDRFQVVVLGIPRPVRNSMANLQQAGVKNMEVSHPCPLVTVTLLHSRRDANGALIGSEVPTIQGDHIYLYR